MEPVNPQALELLNTPNYRLLPYLIFVQLITDSMYYVLVKHNVIPFVLISILPLFISFEVTIILTDVYTYGYFPFDLEFVILKVFFIVCVLVAIVYAGVEEVAGKGIYQLFVYIDRK